MLHAVNRRKARLDAFRNAGDRVPLEDVVTSTLFGPLLFMESEQLAAVTARLLTSLNMPGPAFEGPLQLSLWPKHKTDPALRISHVEPDAVIADAAGTSLLLEIKWGAPLSERELAAQWLSLLADARPRSQHLLIVLEPGVYDRAVSADRQFLARQQPDQPWPLTVRSWRRVADAFQAIGIDTEFAPGIRRWAQAAHAFLKREDPRSLTGWEALDVPAIEPIDWQFSVPWFEMLRPALAIDWRYRENWFARGETAQAHWEWQG